MILRMCMSQTATIHFQNCQNMLAVKYLFSNMMTQKCFFLKPDNQKDAIKFKQYVLEI